LQKGNSPSSESHSFCPQIPSSSIFAASSISLIYCRAAIKRQ
jgi:hypothetical protein